MGKKLETLSYFESDGMVLEDTPKICPKCHQVGQFQVTLVHEYNGINHELLKTHKEVYCGYGCELSDDTSYKPTLDKKALKSSIMASRARIIGDSIEVYNDSDNPYLHGFNCLYIHWQVLPDGNYSVFYDYYLEHGYQGRDKEVGKKEMLTKKKAPTSKEAKELLYAWMVERFEAMTKEK